MIQLHFQGNRLLSYCRQQSAAKGNLSNYHHLSSSHPNLILELWSINNKVNPQFIHIIISIIISITCCYYYYSSTILLTAQLKTIPIKIIVIHHTYHLACNHHLISLSTCFASVLFNFASRSAIFIARWEHQIQLTRHLPFSIRGKLFRLVEKYIHHTGTGQLIRHKRWTLKVYLP